MKRIIFIFIFLKCSFLFAQIDDVFPNLIGPFDSLTVKLYQDRINENKNVPYVLIETAVKDIFFLRNLAHLYDEKYTFEEMNLILNGRNKSPKYGMKIQRHRLFILYEKQTCELLKLIFDQKGDYISPPFDADGKLIFCMLIARGIDMYGGTSFSGYPWIAKDKFENNCN